MYNNFKKFYKLYGEYVVKRRMFPSKIDGLRLVERRILYAAYLEAKEKLKKSAYIVGKANILHPHGESSLYGTLTKLVNFGFMIGQGNWGSKVGIEDEPAAAQRYTEAKLNSNISDMAFELIKFADFDVLEYEKEPLNLPTPIPLGLLFKEINEGIGFGIKTTIPSYRLDDLISRLKGLISSNNDLPIIKPFYGEEIELLSEEKEYEKLLVTGKAQIKFCPKLYINKMTRSITIKNRPVGKKFSGLINALENEIKNGIISVIDKSTKSTNIEISVVKNRKYDFNKLVKLIKQKLTSAITYSIYVINKGDVLENCGIDDMLLSAYQYYLEVVNRKLDNDKQELENKINELQIILLIRPHIKYIIDNNLNKEATLSYLENKINIPKNKIADVIKKYSIEKLLYIHIDIDVLETQLKQLKKQYPKAIVNKKLEKFKSFKI